MFRFALLLVPGLVLVGLMIGLDRPQAGPALAASGAPPVARDAQERKVSLETDLYTFEYAYPGQAAAIPALRALLEDRLAAARAELEAGAKESREDARANDYPFNPHALDINWALIAEPPGWLSLQAQIYSYGGGAPGNQGFDALLWDRKADTSRRPLDLFASASALDTAVRQRYCEELDVERAERREQTIEEVRKDDFWECPAVDELTVALDSAGGQRFDRLLLLAAPYVAGAYVEGSYAVELAIDEAILSVVKPDFRDAFGDSAR